MHFGDLLESSFQPAWSFPASGGKWRIPEWSWGSRSSSETETSTSMRLPWHQGFVLLPVFSISVTFLLSHLQGWWPTSLWRHWQNGWSLTCELWKVVLLMVALGCHGTLGWTLHTGLVLWKVRGYGNCVFNPTSILQIEWGSKAFF